jgi:hypothetical protein
MAAMQNDVRNQADYINLRNRGEYNIKSNTMNTTDSNLQRIQNKSVKSENKGTSTSKNPETKMTMEEFNMEEFNIEEYPLLNTSKAVSSSLRSFFSPAKLNEFSVNKDDNLSNLSTPGKKNTDNLFFRPSKLNEFSVNKNENLFYQSDYDIKTTPGGRAYFNSNQADFGRSEGSGAFDESTGVLTSQPAGKKGAPFKNRTSERAVTAHGAIEDANRLKAWNSQKKREAEINRSRNIKIDDVDGVYYAEPVIEPLD